ncbi:hypothetical protein CMV_030447, partial [Castanea mollissima]
MSCRWLSKSGSY